MENVGVILNMIGASMRTEELLQELKRSNAELEARAGELNEKATLLEQKNSEVELASRSKLNLLDARIERAGPAQ